MEKASDDILRSPANESNRIGYHYVASRAGMALKKPGHCRGNCCLSWRGTACGRGLGAKEILFSLPGLIGRLSLG